MNFFNLYSHKGDDNDIVVFLIFKESSDTCDCKDWWVGAQEMNKEKLPIYYLQFFIPTKLIKKKLEKQGIISS